MAAHSSILAWEIPWTEEPGGYSPAVSARLDGVAKSWVQLSTYLMLPFRVLVIHVVLFFKLRIKLNTVS